MHKTAVAYAVGKLLQIMGLVLIVPLAIAVYDYHPEPVGDIFSHAEVIGFVAAILLALISGTFFALLCRHGKNLQGVKEGFATVTVGWIALTFVSCVPMTLYFIDQQGGEWSTWFISFTDAFFETMSGFTTTGATILQDVEVVPHSLLFLRSLTHWLGGMGIITLAIAIFPAMGVSAYQMFRSEVPGPTKEKLQPRLTQTASVLWGVYVMLSLIEVLLLLASGMGLFDAICHTFATMATGGFSTKNDSIAAYNSPLIEWIIIIFMFLAGVNFLLHFRVFRGDFKALQFDPEFKFYAGTVFVGIVLFTAVLYFGGLAPMETAADNFRNDPKNTTDFALHYYQQEETIADFSTTLRTASFQVVSIITTTGFATVDFDLWVDFLRVGLIVLMFFGGCAGSTGGGMKIIRVMVIAKTAFTELRKMAQPRLVAPVKIANEVIDESRITNITAFFIFFLGLFILCGVLLSLFVPDIETAFSASIAAIGNIGPGLSGVGAIENYSWFPLPAKWIVIVSMLLGRLEIFTILILLRAKTWRK